MTYANFSSRKVGSRGPALAEVLVVGEAPGEDEDAQLKAFVGSSGMELERQLAEAKFIASAVRFTNAIRYRPRENEIDLAFVTSKKAAEEQGAVQIHGRWALPVAVEGLKDLAEEIAIVKPKIIIAVGGTALWATTGKNGIENWRSSQLPCVFDPSITVIPTYHPSAILRQWENRYLAIHDLKRAHRIWLAGPEPQPSWNFRLRPSFATVMECLDIAESHGTLAVDIETKKLHIMCVGIAWNKLDAICIPFVTASGLPYWTEEEETAITLRLSGILTTHRIIGQNFAYDAQYFARRMLCIPTCAFDTMLAQHVLFPGTPKSLAHNSSLYCPYHVFWKDDGKEWDPKQHPEEQLWAYNCTDCVKTFEVMEEQLPLIEKYNLTEQFQELIDHWPFVLNTMLKGVAVSGARKEQAKIDLRAAILERQAWLETVIGRPFNPNSPPQMKQFFIEEMGVKGRKSKKGKGAVSFEKKNLHKVAEQYPILAGIVMVIEEIRSLKVFLNTFAEAPLDEDGRMRCSYNQGGTETFRFSSSANAFYSGTNLQNIPKGDRSTTMEMPNMRNMFVPDPPDAYAPEGYEIAEIDLSGADAQIVAWETNCKHLKKGFKSGLKIHVVNNKAMYGDLAGPDGKREPFYTRVKQGCHAFNYTGTPNTVAKTLAIPLAAAEEFQRKWFGLCPEIPEWHKAIMAELQRGKTVRNIWGYRRVFFDRVEQVLSNAVAWKPQSSIAILINKIWRRLASDRRLPHLSILLQVHDSLVFQYPKHLRAVYLPIIAELCRVPIPYPDPLTIAMGIKVSTRSWGEGEDLPAEDKHLWAA